MLEKERAFYDEHLREWENTIAGRFVVIKESELVGSYDDMNTAFAAGANAFGVSNFLVRKVGQHDHEVCVPALTLGLINASH